MRLRDLLDPEPAPLPPGAGIVRDLAYGADAAQQIDLYRMPGQRRSPVVAFVHGGGWQRGDKAMARIVGCKARHWLARGWTLAMVNYRLLPGTDVLGQADDVAGALAFLQREATALGLERDRIALVGHSAGAHLAALVVSSVERSAASGLQPWRSTVIIDTAMLDVVAVMRRPHFAFYDPVFGADPALWRAASPIDALKRAPLTPLLVVVSAFRGDARHAAEAFVRRAVERGGRARVLAVPLGHMALNQALGRNAAYTGAVDRFLEDPERATGREAAAPAASLDAGGPAAS
ncbi:MAG: alpha/beta hydrolase [Burkholderiales bacterium]|nr:alpha/beta hydrolase [Burkholderiales bacterium]